MAEVKITLTAEEHVSAVTRALRSNVAADFEAIKKAGLNVTDRLHPAFQALGIKSAADIETSKTQIISAFNQIKNSGVATPDEIARAFKGMQAKINEIDIKNGLKDATEESGKLSRSLGDIALPIAAVFSVYKLVSAIKDATSASLEYLKTIETAQLGIASSYTAQGHYIDETTGKVLQGSEALKAAQQDSKNMMGELQVANLQTIATLDQLVKAYQETLPVAMAKGFDQKQVKDFTVAMVQAAGAIGLPMDQLGEETRSILTGTINPRTSRIATVLGLRNEDISQYKDNAQALFDFLMTKLDAYKTAGEAAQHTWAGLMSNTEDLLKKMGGDALEPLFEAVKYELEGVTKSVMTIDEKTGQVKWNEDFVNTIQTIRSGVVDVIAEFYRMGMLLDKIGGSMTALGYVAAGGPMTRLGKWFEEQNKMFEQRYNESDKALQALANREAGLNSDGSGKAADMKVKYVANEISESLKNQQKELKKTEELLKDYSAAVKEAGKDALKFAESEFSSKMKEQERSIDGMKGAMKEYEGVIDSVYGSQVKALEKLKDAMKEAGADPKEIKAQGLAILEAEKAQATARLGAWTKYYETLKGLQATAIEEMKKKQDELIQIKQAGKDDEAFFRKKYGLDTEQALDPFQKFYKDLEKLDADSASAMKLSGDEKIKAVQGVIAKFKELPTEIKDGDDVLISSLDIYDKITVRVGELQTAIEAEKQAQINSVTAWKSALDTAMADASVKITEYQNQIIDLSKQMTSLTLQVKDSQAMTAISGIKSLLASIPSVVTTTVQVNYAGYSASAPAVGPPQADGSYASGTSYVPKTGTYQLHQGEQVLNRSEVTNNQQSRSVTVTMGDIVIQGTNKSPEQLAREIARPLQRGLRQLGAMQ